MGWDGSIWNKMLSASLALAVLGALAMLGYTLVRPGSGERFTEFYLLGLSGKATDYPALLKVGEEGKVVVGIINREQETVTYRVEIKIDGVINSQVGELTLEPDEKQEEKVGFTPNRVGDKQKVELLLYKQGQSEVYRQLLLWLDVR
ncbi:MAG: DUF1616 domain-containing protein [Chloroflexi bacterium]|nr:DUF1616 domain-containing protein [Chloroflexota bacterium]